MFSFSPEPDLLVQVIFTNRDLGPEYGHLYCPAVVSDWDCRGALDKDILHPQVDLVGHGGQVGGQGLGGKDVNVSVDSEYLYQLSIEIR